MIAAAGGADKARKEASYGAHHVIDYTAADLKQEIRRLTNGRGVDVVVDPVGGEMFDLALRVVGWEGRIISVGFASGQIPQAPVNLTFTTPSSVTSTSSTSPPSACSAGRIVSRTFFTSSIMEFPPLDCESPSRFREPQG